MMQVGVDLFMIHQTSFKHESIVAIWIGTRINECMVSLFVNKVRSYRPANSIAQHAVVKFLMVVADMVTKFLCIPKDFIAIFTVVVM